jgi:protein-S-isoprenylcysteine O-methyltransferase Ste14
MRLSEKVSTVEAAHAVERHLGAWAFRHRTWLPIVPALPLLLAPPLSLTWPDKATGVLLVAAGQILRFWAVRHIGVISRTRTMRLGKLITSGPYSFVRNPLYVGNALLWTGFVVWSQVLWMLPIAWAIFALQYGAMAQWEELILSERYPAYRVYAAQVGRWVPRWNRTWYRRPHTPVETYRWSRVLFSERGTLIAEIAMALLLVGKHELR